MNRRQEELLTRIEEAMSGSIFWNEKDLSEALHIPPQATARILVLALEQDRIIRLAPGVLTLPSHMEGQALQLKQLGPTFSVADFRRASGLPREFVTHVLDWFDSQGLTRREVDHRVVLGK